MFQRPADHQRVDQIAGRLSPRSEVEDRGVPFRNEEGLKSYNTRRPLVRQRVKLGPPIKSESHQGIVHMV